MPHDFCSSLLYKYKVPSPTKLHLSLTTSGTDKANFGVYVDTANGGVVGYKSGLKITSTTSKFYK